MTKRFLIPVGALVVALSAGGVVEAGQRDSRGRDRNGRESQGRVAPRQDEGRAQPRAEAQPRTEAQPRSGDRRSEAQRPAPAPAPRSDNRADRGDNRADRNDNRPYRDDNRAYRDDNRAYRGDNRGDRGNNRGYAVPRGNNRYDGRDGNRDAYRYGYPGSRDQQYRYYGQPRLIPGARAPRHYYGRGGSFSVYFGIGRGYLYGSPYAGRVYGYIAPPVYGARIYYGDVRLQVRPRDAAVYVDGYYAGVVDDFDGVFQRLTLEVGPHQIELDAPGLEPQLYDVYVDPARTVTIRADMIPY